MFPTNLDLEEETEKKKNKQWQDKVTTIFSTLLEHQPTGQMIITEKDWDLIIEYKKQKQAQVFSLIWKFQAFSKLNSFQMHFHAYDSDVWLS